MTASTNKDHYSVLGVLPSASQAQIEQAYWALKAAPRGAAMWNIERAYAILSSPAQRRLYDAALAAPAYDPRTARLEPPGAADRRKRLAALAAAAVVLLLALRSFVWPAIGWRFSRFADGTELSFRSNGEPFGQVLRFEAGHRFESGSLDAYLVKRHDSNEERWLNRQEVNQLARPSSQ